MTRNQRIWSVCVLVGIALAVYLGMRAWTHQIVTVQGVVTTSSMARIPEDPDPPSGIMLMTAQGSIELEWERRQKQHEMFLKLDGKHVVVRGIRRDRKGPMNRRSPRIRVIQLDIVPAPTEALPGG